MNNDADVLLAVNVARFPDGGAVSLAAIFGNSLTYDDDLAVTGARVMTQVSSALWPLFVTVRHPSSKPSCAEVCVNLS